MTDIGIARYGNSAPKTVTDALLIASSYSPLFSSARGYEWGETATSFELAQSAIDRFSH
jgi:hypothetical protein